MTRFSTVFEGSLPWQEACYLGKSALKLALKGRFTTVLEGSLPGRGGLLHRQGTRFLRFSRVVLIFRMRTVFLGRFPTFLDKASCKSTFFRVVSGVIGTIKGSVAS